VKSRVSRDLVSALDQAMVDRAFVPSLTALSHVGSEGGHAIQLHRGADFTITRQHYGRTCATRTGR